MSHEQICDARTYLRWLALTIVCACAAFLALSARELFYEYRDAPVAKLARYQIEKVDRNLRANTVFLGDSSLGNSIDARLFSELFGKRTINLALTGSQGFGGSFALLQRVLAEYRPANVVLVNSMDIMRREVEYQGYLFTADENSVRAETLSTQAHFAVVLARRLFSLSAAFETLQRLSPFRKATRASLSLKDDYIAQNVAEIGQISAAELRPREVNELNSNKAVFLDRIVSLCRNAELNCVFAFGPVVADQCERSADYISAAARLIRSAGLEVIDRTPLCVPRSEIGDAMDHVMPSAKVDYTRRYFHLLNPFLR